MSGAFKTIATKNITRHTAHKSYEVVLTDSSGSFSAEPDLEVFFYQGAINPGEYGLADTATTNGYNKRDIYSSINTNFYKKVEGPPGEGGGFQGHVDSTFKGSKRVLLETLGSIGVWSIPYLMMGDGIKPGSVTLNADGGDFHDDGDGNLLITSTSAKIGNVFYTHGVVVLHSSSNLAASTIKFKNTHVIEEHEYMCNASKHEFNATTNHSIVSSSGDMHGFVSSSAWNPYVTSVGLYDLTGDLLVVGKLGQPIKKSEKYDTSYVIRFDT